MLQKTILNISLFGAVLFWLSTTLSHAGDPEWKTLNFSGIDQNEFIISDDGQIDIFMDKSSSVLYRNLTDEEKNHAYLSWEWKIEMGFPATPLADKTKDDRPLAVHVWFPKAKNDRNKGLKEFFGRLLGYDYPGRVITYVWGGTEQQGDIIENPHFEERGFLVVLKPGKFTSDGWVAEKINFLEDYKNIFGEMAPMPTHLAISGDSDHSMMTASSSVRMINFSADDNLP